MTNNATSPKTRLKKSIACNRCHSRKVRCNGKHPCASCTSHGRPQECSYPNRNSRKVLVEESYIDGLVAELRRLRSTSEASLIDEDVDGPATSREQRLSLEQPTTIENLWFEHQSNHDLPVYIGEAACAAFATRARQALSNTTDGGHLVRTQFISDEQLMLPSSDLEMNFPSRMQASILVRIAQSTIGKLYYLLQWSTIESTITSIYEGPDRASNRTFCKALLVFALGELYASQAMVSKPGTYPGLPYFREAQRRLNMCPERCTLEDIEIYLMTVLYSLALNRRNSAFYLIGTAVKLAIGLGLHHPISQAQMPNDNLRNHRNRLWWTIYILDRTLTSSLGHPVSIDDSQIDNTLPESSEDQSTEPDVFDSTYYHALIGWSKIIGTVDDSVFDRSLTVDQVLQRADHKVQEFERWHDGLPVEVQINERDSVEQNSRKIIMLHLAYNQAIILCTRASLHYMLRLRQRKRPLSAEHTSPMLMNHLADRCRIAASESIGLIVGLFVSGAVPTFDYFYTHYLFSASTIASIAAVLDPSMSNLAEDISSAETVLQSCSLAGNLAAKEFVRNIDAFRNVMSKLQPQTSSLQDFEPIAQDVARQSTSMAAENDLEISSLMMPNNHDSIVAGSLFSNPWFEGMNLPDTTANIPWLYAWPEFSANAPDL